ncbi:protein flightless-1 homolog [Melanaphis sacchari]|uniref:Leucine-rich repeat protein SHOC-2 n=1 Tax=Melanaphis sacchari TaxID=742174 RepID=A0A2H8TUL5_9HEMI|nr:protein flightless-1 homolog [Melanaphis sacchari]XP_025200725.1 protein flightless-1 homolog [Melanaphis sacchari]
MDISKRCSCSCCDQCMQHPTFHTIQKLCNIKCLDHLTTLDISSSSICEVPEFIGNLINLVKLDLSSNELKTLPLSLIKCQHLTDLILSYNQFSQVPQCLIDGVHSLKTLDLSHNQLVDISIKPFSIQQLLTLNVSNNSKLNTLPQWLWSIECNSLESLDISFTNCLDNIAVDPYLNMYGISNHLKYLYLSNTNSDIRKIEFIKNLKNLRNVVLDNKDTKIRNCRNYYHDVPLVFNYRFKFIDSLSMIDVDLSTIGSCVYFSFPSIRFLNLSNNSIVLLPDSFSELINLEVCDVSNNQILSIPESFKSLKNLKSLILNNNWLSTFPEIIEDLLNLEILDLYTNKLTICPSWNSNSNIKLLDLEQNAFSTETNIDINTKANYSNLLKNLRSSIAENRVIGPLCFEEPNDAVSETDSSSSHWSNLSDSEHSDHELVNIREVQDNTCCTPEEFWDCDVYEFTTDLFDPKSFELILMKELTTLEKSLYVDENIVRNVRLANEHYFCPNDELPKSL